MILKNSLASVLAVFWFMGCEMAQKPTSVSTPPHKVETIYALEEPVMITEETVVLDARPFYQYTTGHLPMAHSVQPSDFTQKTQGFEGKLQNDLAGITRRLALLGVQPGAQVVVVGQGVEGKGEEGFVAWMINYLGVESVQAVPNAYFDIPLTTEKAEVPENASAWRPQLYQDLMVPREEILKTVAKPKVNPDTFIIDVRSEGEYLQKTKDSPAWPDVGAININWKEFFDDEGRPEVSLTERLKGVGITPDKRVMVISDKGYRSAAVTMALREMGFSKAGNVSGGYAALTAETDAKKKK